jgi:hypothetical protein
MLTAERPNENGVVRVTVVGELTADDLQAALPDIERWLEKRGRLRFLIDLTEMRGFETAALREDLRFDMKHGGDYGRTAVIGSGLAEEWLVRISDLFFSGEMRFFDAEEAGEAERWIDG